MLLLSVTVNVAARVPAAVGTNLTLIVQLPLAATDPAQVFVCVKSPGLVPENAMLAMLRVALPVLFSVNVWAVLVEPTFWPLKVRLEAVSPARGPLPVPVRPAVCGLPVSESEMLTAAVRVNGAVGANLTEIVQVPLCASEPGQLLVWE